MTLKEAVERYTSNAEYERTHGNLQGCLEFRQLAEWLKDYKRMKEQEPKTGHWIISPNDYFVNCSECGLHGDKGIYKHYRWCPKCGTKMSEIPTDSEPQESEG